MDRQRLVSKGEHFCASLVTLSLFPKWCPLRRRHRRLPAPYATIISAIHLITTPHAWILLLLFLRMVIARHMPNFLVNGINQNILILKTYLVRYWKNDDFKTNQFSPILVVFTVIGRSVVRMPLCNFYKVFLTRSLKQTGYTWLAEDMVRLSWQF